MTPHPTLSLKGRRSHSDDSTLPLRGTPQEGNPELVGATFTVAHLC